jgi:hypothetical protein
MILFNMSREIRWNRYTKKTDCHDIIQYVRRQMDDTIYHLDHEQFERRIVEVDISEMTSDNQCQCVKSYIGINPMYYGTKLLYVQNIEPKPKPCSLYLKLM